MSSFSVFNDSGYTTVRSEVVALFCCQSGHFLNLPVPGIDIAMDWMVQHPTDQYTRTKKCRNTFIHACVFFLSHLRVFSAHYFVKLRPFRNSYPGSCGTHFSLFPTTERAFVYSRAKKMFRIKFPSLASPCAELVCIHATYQYNKQHVGCEALSAVSLYI